MIKQPKGWSLHDLKFVLKEYEKTGSQKQTQKQINKSLIMERKRLGTWRGEKNLSWKISRLSPTSKHRIPTESKIRSEWGHWNITKHIAKCLKIDLYEASSIYTNRIIESGIAPYDFYDPNQRNLSSIRFDYSTCDAPIYIAFTSEDYPGFDDEVVAESDIWTVKTNFTYREIITGKVDLYNIYDYLIGMADGEYAPIFVNTLIYRRDD